MHWITEMLTNGSLGPYLLEHNTDGVRVPTRIMRSVA